MRFDRFTRGRYATDASHYQVTPDIVLMPRTVNRPNRRCRKLPVRRGRRVLPRGGGTSQAGQTVGESLVVDCSKH